MRTAYHTLMESKLPSTYSFLPFLLIRINFLIILMQRCMPIPIRDAKRDLILLFDVLFLTVKWNLPCKHWVKVLQPSCGCLNENLIDKYLFFDLIVEGTVFFRLHLTRLYLPIHTYIYIYIFQKMGHFLHAIHLYKKEKQNVHTVFPPSKLEINWSLFRNYYTL